MKCEKWTDQHDTSLEQKNLSTRQESNPGPTETVRVLYSLTYENSWRVESKVI